MGSPDVVTIPVIPYTLLLATSLLFVFVSYAHILPLGKIFPAWDHSRGSWALYSAGQLHREVVERVRGEFTEVDTSHAWPTVATQSMGPEVITRRNVRRFGSGELFRLPLFLNFPQRL